MNPLLLLAALDAGIKIIDHVAARMEGNGQLTPEYVALRDQYRLAREKVAIDVLNNPLPKAGVP